MKVQIVHAHHERKSFNAALLDTAVEALESADHEVTVSDLYAMGFDPVSDRRNFESAKDPEYLKQQVEEMHASESGGFATDVAAEQEKLLACDALIFQFPLWWFGMPAILKGWVDRVFAMGLTYGYGQWYDRGVFRGKRAIASLTTGGPATMYSTDGLNPPIEQVLVPLHHGVWAFTGFDVLPPFVAWGPAHVDDETRQGYLDEWKRRVLAIETTEPIAYPGLDEFDENTFTRKKA